MTTRRIPWRSQPQTASVNWASPLARGLVRCVLFNAGPKPFDAVTGAYLTQVSSNFSRAVTGQGTGLKNNDESSYWTMPILAETVNSMSMGWVGQYASGSTPIMVRDGTATVGSYFFRSNTGWQLRAGGTDSSSAGTFSANTPYAACATLSASGGNQYVNGALVNSGATNGGSALVSPWYIHQNGTNAQGILASALLIPVWSRPLTPVEALGFTMNPWQLLAPAKQPIWITASSNVTLPTLGRPAADTSAGLWTPSSGGALYPMLNEVSANDSNFINVAALSTCEMVLDNTAYPGGANQTLSYRAFSSTGNGLTVTLKQGSTTIASWSHALTGTPTLYTQTLTSGQIAAIVAGPISVTLTST
jgi:hypothetical protein